MAKKPVPIISENSASQNKVNAKNAAKAAPAPRPAPKPALASPSVVTPGAIPVPGRASVPYEPGMGAGPGGSDAPSGGDTGGGGDTSSGYGAPAFDPLALANDWYKAFFNSYGLPGDVQSEIMRILRTYAADPATAQALSQQYLRTTDWFAKTYPGFNQGVASGLFTDETGYRGYLNQVNQTFNQYLGRHVTGEEVSGYLASGYNPGYVGSLLQGQAWTRANGNDTRYLSGAFGDEGQITEPDLETLGKQHAGIDTPRGLSLDVMLSRAQQRLQTIVQGRLVTPGLSLGSTGLSAPTLAGNRQTPDVGA